MATMTSEERLEEFKKVYHENDVTLKGADIGVVMAYFVIIIGIGIFVSNRALTFLSFINESSHYLCWKSILSKNCKREIAGCRSWYTIYIDRRCLYAINPFHAMHTLQK